MNLKKYRSAVAAALHNYISGVTTNVFLINYTPLRHIIYPWNDCQNELEWHRNQKLEAVFIHERKLSR